MARTGKTGADAILLALKKICRVLVKYQAKLVAVVNAAEIAGAITTAEAVTIGELIGAANAYCAAFDLLAEFSGFDTNP